MKLTKSKLKQIIQEELKSVLDEVDELEEFQAPKTSCVQDCMKSHDPTAGIQEALAYGTCVAECVAADGTTINEADDDKKDERGDLEKVTGLPPAKTKKALDKIKNIGKKKSKKSAKPKKGK
jgi:hypothetical protein